MDRDSEGAPSGRASFWRFFRTRYFAAQSIDCLAGSLQRNDRPKPDPVPHEMEGQVSTFLLTSEQYSSQLSLLHSGPTMTRCHSGGSCEQDRTRVGTNRHSQAEWLCSSFRGGRMR